MEQKSLGNWLKVIIYGVVICGLIVYAAILPSVGHQMVLENVSELQKYYIPWLIFIWISGIPCYTVLFFSWKIANNIGKDKSFSVDNAMLLKKISHLASGTSVYFFIGNVIFFFLKMNRPSILLYFLIIMFIGIAVSVVAAALSHLVMKASDLQELSDGTI